MKPKFKVGDRVRYIRADNLTNLPEGIFWISGLEIIITEVNPIYHTIGGTTLNSEIINGFPNSTYCGNMEDFFKLIKSNRRDFYLPKWF